jgi:hypothetical protein
VTSLSAEISPRQAAWIAGLGNLIIFVLSVFANFLVVEGLIEPGDAAAAAAKHHGF